MNTNPPSKPATTITYSATFAVNPQAPAGERIRIRAVVQGYQMRVELAAATELEAHRAVCGYLENIFLRPAKEIQA